MFGTVPQLPHPNDIPGSAAAKLRAIERQIGELIEERHRLRRLLLGDPFKMEERLSRLAKLAARAEALASEHQLVSSSANAP